MNSKAIYGLFENGVCLYVGASCQPDKRFQQHQWRTFKGRIIDCRIFRWVRKRIGVIEGQIIRAYQRRGQAQFNKQFNRNSTVLGIDKIIDLLWTKKRFTVPSKADRKMALTLGRAMGKKVATRKNGDGGFKVYVLE